MFLAPARFLLARGVGIALIGVIVLGPVHAQEPRDAYVDPDIRADKSVAEGEEKKPRRNVIEEIVVTATKREESVRDIAASVTALTGEDLEDSGIQDIDEIVDAVPGVNLVDDGQGFGSRISVRGISAGLYQNDTAGVFIDETPFTDVFVALVSADANPFDMSSVEVLKGPVGTLFGGSALNGAIRYIPQKPVYGEWQTKVFSQFSTNARSEDMGRIFGVAVNIPIFDTLALRVVGIDRKSEGWIDSLNQSYQALDINKVKQQSMRAILRWQPLEPLDLSLMLLDQDTRVHDSSHADSCCGGGYERTGSPRSSPSRTNYQTWQLKGAWAFDWADLVLVASQSDKHVDNLIDESFLAESDPQTSTAVATAKSDGQPQSQELRLVSTPGGDWDWLGGLFHYKYSVNSAIDLSSSDGFGGVDALPQRLNADVSENAMFGEVSWRFADRFELTGGLRVYEFSYLGESAVTGPACLGQDPTCPATGFRGATELDETERGTNPKLGLKWELSDEVMSYATVVRGFRFGGVNRIVAPRPDVPTIFRSDSLWNYELGVRARWLEGSLITDATVFAIDWDDAQYFTVTSDGVQGYTDNVGAVDGVGMESQIVWLPPLPGVSVTLIPAYAEIVTAEDYTTPSDTGSGTTTPAGSPWPRAPKWQTAATLAWSGQVGARQLGAALTHRYYGKAIQGFQAGQQHMVFGYATYDLQVTVKKVGAGWWPDLILNLNNLTNARGDTYIFPPVTSTSGDQRFYTAPRNFSLRLSLDF